METIANELSEPETWERVEPHRLTRVEDTEYISLLQRAPLLGREEVPADAGNIRPKFHGQDFGNINDTNSIRRFWLLFLPTPNTPAHVDDF